MRETPRPQGTADGTGSAHPQLRPGRALAHTGASGSGTPHRSDSRPPHTPRGARPTDRIDRPGTPPPVPGRSAFLPLLLPLLCAVLFALVTWQVTASGPLQAADEDAGRAASGSGVPHGLAEFCADLGSALIALPLLAVVVLVCAWRDRRSGVPRWWLPALVAVLTSAAVPALVVPLKILVARPGPHGPMEGYPGYYPSGHAATAAAAYGLAALVLREQLRRAATRRLTVAAVCAVVAAVGAGLVLRGYHWPLDVIGSWCLAGLLLWCAGRGLRARAGRERDERAVTPGP